MLDVLQDATESLPLHEVSRRAGMDKATTLRYLSTMVGRRYVERDVLTGEYRLGMAGPLHAQVYDRLARVTRPALERIGERFKETTSLSVLAHYAISCLDFIDSPHAIRLVVHPESREYLHSTAVGKAIGATLPPDVVREIVETTGMPARTPRTIVDVEELLAHLAVAHDQGYAIGDQENDPWARGVAVVLPTARIHAAIGISAPAERFALEQAADVAAVLRAEAARVASAFDAGDIWSAPRADPLATGS